MNTWQIFLLGSTISIAAVAAVLLVPPIRGKVFTTSLWPWALPWDTTEEELERIKKLSRPGDVIIESNLHGWQWIALCTAATGTTWVHGALVDESEKLLTVEKQAIEADFDIYLRWGSTRLALIRPPYKDADQAKIAINHARQHLGTAYDASFQNDAGNCNGLVAGALKHAGVDIKRKQCLGREIYAPDCFEQIPGAEIVWLSDRDRHSSSPDDQTLKTEPR